MRISTSIQHTAYIPPLALVLDLLTKNVEDEDKKATPRERGFAGTARYLETLFTLPTRGRFRVGGRPPKEEEEAGVHRSG